MLLFSILDNEGKGSFLGFGGLICYCLGEVACHMLEFNLKTKAVFNYNIWKPEEWGNDFFLFLLCKVKVDNMGRLRNYSV